MAAQNVTSAPTGVDLDAWHQQYAAIWGAHDLPDGGVLTFARVAQPDELSAGARDSGRAPMTCRHAPVGDLAACDSAITDLSRGGTLGVYVVTGVMSPTRERDGVTVPRGRSDKGRKADVLAVTVLDVDIDLRGTGGGHAASDEQLPAMEDASAIVAELRPLIGRPALTVHSGGGLHLRYALAEPTDPASTEMVEAYARWKALWQSAFARRGFTVDPTPLTNPAGLLRVAGTVNSKYGRPVRVLKANPGAQLTMDDLDRLPASPKPEPREAWKRAGDGTGFAGSTDIPDASLPLERLARTPGTLALLLGAGGLVAQNSTGTLWGFPRPDGTISDPNVVVYADAVDRGEDAPVLIERVVGHGSRFNAPAPEGWGLDGHAWSAASVLIHRFCGGDASLAARIAARSGTDPALIADAVRDIAPNDLAATYRAKPRIMSVQPAETGSDLLSADSATTVATHRGAAFGLAFGGGGDGTVVQPTIGVAAVTSPDVAEEVVTMFLQLTGYGFAERWVLYEGASWRVSQVPGADDTKGQWHHWNGRVWAPAATSDLRHSIVAVARHVAEVEAIHHGQAVAASAGRKFAADRGSIPEPKRGQPQLTAEEAAMVAGGEAAIELRAWAREYEERYKQDAVMAILPSLRGVSVDIDAWDADPLLLNTPVGVVDLRTGERRPHDPLLMMTQITRGSGDDVPMTTELETLLAHYETSGDGIRELVDWLTGIEITGMSPGAFSHLYGVAGCGKSTIGKAKVLAFGTYAMSIEVKALEKRRAGGGDSPDPILTSMRGKRFVYVDEAAMKVLEADLIKSLVSGGLMTTRGLHKDATTWRSRVTLGMCGNGELLLSDIDDGLARRFFPMKLTEKVENPDPAMEAALHAQAGLDAILAWAIRNAVEWVRGGQHVSDAYAPSRVLDERAAYLSELDPLERWMDARVVALTEEKVEKANADLAPTTSALHEDYYDYCRTHGATALTEKAFSTRLVRKHRVTGREMRNGVRGRFVEDLRLKALEGRNF